MRSFGLVDEKAYEADFFLEKVKESNNLYECRLYTNAFASTCRSITFTLQAVMKEISGFSTWYSQKQQFLSNNRLARFFVRLRNESQKIGSQYVSAGKSYVDCSGITRMKFFFSSIISICLSITKHCG